MAYTDMQNDDDAWSGSALSADIAKQRLAEQQAKKAQEASQPSGGDRALGGVKGALSGAAAGATLGSAVPGIGTAIGAAIGGTLGGATGALTASPSEKTPGLGSSISSGQELYKQIKKSTPESKALQEAKENPMLDLSDADLAS